MRKAVVWERRQAGRVGQAHVFDAAGLSLCKSAKRAEDWGPDTSGRKCASCRRRVDPEGAPKAPSWRRPA